MVVKYFDVAVQAIFKNWTALQLLVTNVRSLLFIDGNLPWTIISRIRGGGGFEKAELIITALFRKLEDETQKLKQSGLNKSQ